MQFAVLIFERLLAMMFCDDDGIVCQQGIACISDQTQYQGVFFGSLIWRIEKDEIEVLALLIQALHRSGRAARFELVAFANA